MILIADYGMGNLSSIIKAFEYVGEKISITKDPDMLKKADKIVLPGVGAFQTAMENISKNGMDDSIKDEISKGKPFLGICLGFQLLFSGSEETRKENDQVTGKSGMGIVEGRVVRFRDDMGLKVPQIGWNSVYPDSGCSILNKYAERYFYFVHSYYPAQTGDDIKGRAYCEYGERFVCAIEKDNILACQFHPEKSGDAGIELIRDWSSL
ncbi:MAG: imidazole glycerol phosphate synthase subunit HisH [Clostridia bacterium]